MPVESGKCDCVNIESDILLKDSNARILPVFFKEITREFSQVLFEEKWFRFRCCCEMYRNLSDNKGLRENIRRVIVHWGGPQSDKAFRVLAKCPNLEKLTIILSRWTVKYDNPRANLLKKHFWSPSKIPLSDALGLDELLEIRGLSDVWARDVHVGTRSNKLGYADAPLLTRLLRSQLTQPKEVCIIFFCPLPQLTWYRKRSRITGPYKNEWTRPLV